MNKEYCEKVRISAMAIFDGERPLLSEREIKEHIESCEVCRVELEEQKSAAKLLDGRSRRTFDFNVLPGVEAAIEQPAARPKYRLQSRLFVSLGLVLFACKIIEVLPVFAPGIIFKLMSPAIIFVFFILLRQNPFAINKNLILKGDLK